MPEVEARLGGLDAGLRSGQDGSRRVGRKRLEQEKLGTAAVSDDVNFSVIQPPIADFNPTVAESTGVLVGVSSCIGGGMAVSPTWWRCSGRYSRAPASSKNSAQFPVLGTVSAMHSPSHRLQVRRQLLLFCSLGVLFVVTFGMLVGLREQAAAVAQSLFT